jgi:hypothetical protein
VRRLATLVAILAALPVGAAAGATTTWTAVTSSLGSGIYQAGQVRSADGTLHVVWRQDVPGGSSEIFHASISPSGVISSAVAVSPGFASPDNPAIVSTASGLEVYFGAIQCTTSSSCLSGLFSSSSADGGVSWSAPALVLNADQAYASDVNATTLSDGTPFQTWWHTTGTTVHRSDSATSPDYDFQGAMSAGCCGYYSNLAADGAGHLQLAWDSNATGFIGTWSSAVDPTTGAPSGAPMLMPGSVTSYSGAPNQSQMGSRTPIVALPGAANRFFVAYPAGYPTTTNVLLWDVGQPTSTTVISEPGDHNQVSLAVDVQGRIWVFWTHTETDGPHVFARRLGTGGLEPVIDLGAPAGTNAIYAIDGAVDSSGDPEVLALAGLSNGTYQTFYARGPQVAPVPAPVLGKSFNAAVVSGTVLVKLPAGAHAGDALAKGQGFTALTGARSLPAGTSVDARAGSIALVTATGKLGKTQSGVFGGGLFKLSQDRTGLTKGLTTLSLLEGDFAGAPGYAQCAAKPASDRGAAAPLGSAAAANPKKVLQTLHASDNHGRFRTRTRASAATVRGTVWDTIDKCGGTITHVHRGTVDVFNLHTRKTFVVHAGHSYYARLP